MRLQYLFILLFIVIFSSCTKDASEGSYARIPEFKRKLVITAFVSPDKDPNKINIETTLQRFGERNFIDIRPLKIFLYEDLNEVQLDTICNIRSGKAYDYYIRDFKFKEGSTYTLKVISDAGLEAEATCRIPLKRDCEIKVDTSSSIITNEYGSSLLIRSAQISIKDFSGEANFYRLLFYEEKFTGGKGYLSGKSSSDNPVTPAWNPDDGDVMHNDIGRDGERIILRSIEFRPYDLKYSNEPDSSFLRVYLLNTDKQYNDFHLSFHNYTSGDDPFTEPTLIYSNVKGGVGIFASYVVDSLIFRLK